MVIYDQIYLMKWYIVAIVYMDIGFDSADIRSLAKKFPRDLIDPLNMA